MRAHVDAGGDEVRPKPGMGTSGQEIEAEHRNDGEHGLDEGLSPTPMLIACSMDAVQQLGCGDRGDAGLLARIEAIR